MTPYKSLYASFNTFIAGNPYFLRYFLFDIFKGAKCNLCTLKDFSIILFNLSGISFGLVKENSNQSTSFSNP